MHIRPDKWVEPRNGPPTGPGADVAAEATDCVLPGAEAGDGAAEAGPSLLGVRPSLASSVLLCLAKLAKLLMLLLLTSCMDGSWLP